MQSRFAHCIFLLIILAVTVPVFASAAPGTGNTRLPLTTAPATTTSCSVPCQCLAYAEAVSLWGAGGFTQCAELPCEVTRSATGAPAEKFCYKQKPLTTVTTQFAIPAITTPLNQFASATPTTSPTPFAVPETTPLASAATQTPTPVQFAGIPTPGPGTFDNGTRNRLIINIGKFQYTPLLRSDSPYLVANAQDKYFINTFLETDSADHGLTHGTIEFPVLHNWADYAKLTIGKDEAEHVGNFRFNSSAKNVRMFLWQVSRYQFPNDPQHWQAKYIPGLVAQGPVELLWSNGGSDFTGNNLYPVSSLPTGSQKNTVDSDGFQYFRINFARIARHNPGDPPYYDGIAHYNPAGSGGRVVVADITRLPFNAGGVSVNKVNFGFLSLGIPTGYTAINPGEFTESEMAHPNEGLTLTCLDCSGLRVPSPLEKQMTDDDQKFYVRLVPIDNNDKAGIPTIPVEVTVHRPQPCPTITQDVTVKPPSARIVWYMRPFGYGSDTGYNQWVTIGHAAFWNASAGNGGGSGNGAMYGTLSGGYDYYESGMHYVVPPAAPPEEKSFLEKIIATFGKILDYIAFIVNQYSQLWNKMKEEVVTAAATVLSYGTTLGYVKCEDIEGCREVLSTALDMAMVAVGLPPTLPTSSELTDMGTDYLVKLGADQLGAGEVYETAKDIYNDVPDFAKKPMHDSAESTAQLLVNGQTEARHNMVFNGQNCEMYQYYSGNDPTQGAHNCVNKTPDPIFHANHPATVMVWVENPNPANSPATDRVVLTVSDAWNLYEKETRIIPSLRPGEGIPVPVVMNEDYNQFRKENGGPCEWDGITWTDNVHTTSSTNEEECVQGKWVAKLYQQGEDSFKVTFSARNAGTGGAEIANLDEKSSGTGLGVIINTDSTCVIQHRVRYPPGWQIYTTGYSINPLGRDNLFEENGIISSTRGYMRKK